MASCPPPDVRLNISQDDPDSILRKTLDVIHAPNDEIRIATPTGASGIDGAVKVVLQQSPQPGYVMLDLIAHSSSDGILQLGNWSVDDGVVLHAALKKVSKLELCGVRLLGCNTAATETGREVVRRLAAQLRTCVWGTNGPIGASHFNADGFAKDTMLTCDEDLPPPTPSPPSPDMISIVQLRRQRWFERFAPVPGVPLDQAIGTLRTETLAEIGSDRLKARTDLRWPLHLVSSADFLAVFDYVIPTLAAAPGLLALPDGEFVSVVPGAGTPRFQRATILLGGAFLRVYPRDRPEGLIVRVDPAHDKDLRTIIARSSNPIAAGAAFTVPRLPPRRWRTGPR